MRERFALSCFPVLFQEEKDSHTIGTIVVFLQVEKNPYLELHSLILATCSPTSRSVVGVNDNSSEAESPTVAAVRSDLTLAPSPPPNPPVQVPIYNVLPIIKACVYGVARQSTLGTFCCAKQFTSSVC